MVLKALMTRASGSSFWNSSAADVPVVASPLASAFSGLVASTTVLPATASRISRATSEPAPTNGTARMTTPARDAASTLLSAAATPTASAACRALSGVLALMVTSCPARLIEPARALPTLPAPMMATFMVDPFQVNE
jgi:hypothetical protein